MPEELIAQHPLEDRAASRLLVVNKQTGELRDAMFRQVPEILEPGDLLVLNDTRVTAIRLFGHKLTGGAIEALLLRPGLSPGSFVAMMKPGKRLKPGTAFEFDDSLRATVLTDIGDGLKEIQFEAAPSLGERLTALGQVPLPPYITETLNDSERYQTVYAREGGSSAAPTAGLHFTPELLDQLRHMGVRTATVTLDVGIDTFRPVAVEDLSQHEMHGERCTISEATAEAINRAEGRIIAVGTTSVRTLESFAAGGKKVRSGEMTTKIFITPGYEWQVVDGMFTNFHMPKTTMMMMVAAMVGREQLLRAYRHAVENDYRFLSFGDSMLVESPAFRARATQ